MRSILIAVSAVTFAVAMAACEKKKKADTAEGAQVVFENFQPTIEKIIAAGLANKDAPGGNGANVPTIGLVGLVEGTGAIGGTIAQGGGGNQNLNLWVQLIDYSDTGDVVFNTDNTDDTTKLQFGCNIQAQPGDNTLNGDLDGELTVEGDVEGTATFNLHFETDLDDDDANPFLVCTLVTGDVATATNTTSFSFMLVHLTSALNPTQQAACDAL